MGTVIRPRLCGLGVMTVPNFCLQHYFLFRRLRAMLKLMRKNTKVIIWTVIGSFAIWGGYSIGFQVNAEGQRAGTVFGKTVSFQEFNQFSKATELFSFQEEVARNPEVLRQQTWQNIIFSREAKRLKIKVKDEEVRAEVAKILGQQKLSQISGAAYQRWVKVVTGGGTPRQFEEIVREMLRIKKLVEQVTSENAPKPTRDEARVAFMERQQGLSSQIVVGQSQSEVADIRDLVKEGKAWQEKVTTTETLELKREEKQNLAALKTIWKLSDEQVKDLFALEQGQLSEVIEVEGKFLLFIIGEKHTVNPSKFDEEGVADAFIQEMVEFEITKRFLEWNIDLLGRSELKDEMLQPKT